MPNSPFSAYARGVLMMAPLVLFLHLSNVARWHVDARSVFRGTLGSSIFRASAAELRTTHEPLGLRARPFESNEGQHGEHAKFFCRAGGYDLYLAAGEAVLALRRSEAAPDAELLRTRYVGACSEVRLTGLDRQPERVHYFLGSDPAGWRPDVPTFGRVRYEGLYPGIDLLYGARAEQLEYGFVVGPGADPSAIELAFEGARDLRVDGDGSLCITTSWGQVLRMHAPSIRQEVGGGKRAIAGGYELRDVHSVGFRIASYDRSRPLMIGR